MKADRPGWVRRIVYNRRNDAPAVATVDLVGETDIPWVGASGGMSHDQGKRVILKSIRVAGRCSNALGAVLVLQVVEDPTGTPIIRDLMSWVFPVLATGAVGAVESFQEWERGIPIAMRASGSIARTAKLRFLLRNIADGADVNFATQFAVGTEGQLSIVAEGEWGGYADSDWDTSSIM